MRDPKSTSTIRKPPHRACTLDNVPVDVKFLFSQLYYQQVALVFKEEFHKKNRLWRKAYIPDLFSPPRYANKDESNANGSKKDKQTLFKALNVDY